MPVNGSSADRSRVFRSGFVVSDFMALVLLLLAVLGALLDRTLLSLVGALVLAVVLFARIWTRVVLEGVHYSLSVAPDRVFVGDQITLMLSIENRKRLPVSRIRVCERLPAGLVLIGDEDSARRTFGATLFDAVTSLAPNERVRIGYRLRALRRGHYHFGPARIEAGDPFGFYTASHAVMRPLANLVVYPKLVAPPPLIPLIARPMGDVAASRWQFDDRSLPSSVREYRAGDPVRTIDWKVTARRGKTHVRTHDPSLSGTIVLLLECDTRTESTQQGSPVMLERCVTAAASLASELVSRRYSVGLLANGVPPGDRARLVVPPGAGARQLGVILESLARVQPIVVRPLPILLDEHARRLLPFGASVICVTGAGSPEISTMLNELASRSHPALLAVLVDSSDPACVDVRVTRYRGFQSQRTMAAAGR
ncbi:MAG TPA: DUF58 domain-containing protein [Gammaproteobacteria bacterium]